LVCNGVVLFDDAGALLPDGQAIAPRAAVTAATINMGSLLMRMIPAGSARAWGARRGRGARR
jgi:hypothetical protein